MMQFASLEQVVQLDTLHDRQTVYQLHDAFCCVFLVFLNEITKKSVHYCTRAIRFCRFGII